jgi:hypothetical protein
MTIRLSISIPVLLVAGLLGVTASATAEVVRSWFGDIRFTGQ